MSQWQCHRSKAYTNNNNSNIDYMLLVFHCLWLKNKKPTTSIPPINDKYGRFDCCNQYYSYHGYCWYMLYYGECILGWIINYCFWYVYTTIIYHHDNCNHLVNAHVSTNIPLKSHTDIWFPWNDNMYIKLYYCIAYLVLSTEYKTF